MLQFFRKHQKYFFIFITLVIVTSFVFFGTYQAFAPTSRTQKSEAVLFRTSEGRSVSAAYLEQMTLFLEQEEAMPATQWFACNYLNEGIISRYFLEGGCALPLLSRCEATCRDALASALEREKAYRPYHHPAISTLSAPQIWALFAPDINQHLAALQASEDPIASFPERVALFLSERRFPPTLLAQVIRYQERSSPSKKDEQLAQGSLALFGYHDHRDWLGRPFTQEVAKVVIQGAALARSKGYLISPTEARAEVLLKSQRWYNALAGKVSLPVENGAGLFHIYLKYRGMDEESFFRLWEDVALFQRMMDEVGRAPLVDSLALEEFSTYAYQQATVQVYQMAPELRFASEREARYFDSYLHAVAALDETGQIPVDYAPLTTIEKRHPELVGKRYRVMLRACSLDQLYAKIGVKEMWEWQCAHLEELCSHFPGLPERQDGEDPFTYLTALTHREPIDTYARTEMIKEHPEWITEALVEAEPYEKALFISEAMRQQNDPLAKEILPGVGDAARFAVQLDAQDEIAEWTEDQHHYYAWTLVDRPEAKEVLSFKEARTQGLLHERSDTPLWSFADYLAAHYLTAPEGALAKQWVVETREMTVSRATETFITMDEVAALAEDVASPVRTVPHEGAFCFVVKEKGKAAPLSTQKWMELQEWAAKEVRLQVFENLLTMLP